MHMGSLSNSSPEYFVEKHSNTRLSNVLLLCMDKMQWNSKALSLPIQQ